MMILSKNNYIKINSKFKQKIKFKIKYKIIKLWNYFFFYYCIQYMYNVIFIIYDEIKFAVVKQAS